MSSLQVAYQRILQLTYIDDLLTAMKRLFIHYFEPILTAFVASLHATAKSAVSQATSWDFQKSFKNWDVLFDKILRELEEKAATVRFLFHNSVHF